VGSLAHVHSYVAVEAIQLIPFAVASPPPPPLPPPMTTTSTASTAQGTCCQAVAYATIFSSTIQPTDQPTNFDLCVTDFSVTVVQIFDP